MPVVGRLSRQLLLWCCCCGAAAAAAGSGLGWILRPGGGVQLLNDGSAWQQQVVMTRPGAELRLRFSCSAASAALL